MPYASFRLRSLRSSFAVKPVVNAKPFEFMGLGPECNADLSLCRKQVFRYRYRHPLRRAGEQRMTFCRTSDVFRGAAFALCFASFSRLTRPEDLRQLLRRIDHDVRNRLLQGVRSEPI